MSNEMQQIIVYRNPVEAALWTSASSSPDIVLGIIIWMVLTVPIVVLMFKVFSRFANRNMRNRSSSNSQIILLALGCVISAALTYGVVNSL